LHYIYYFDIAALFIELLVIIFFNCKKFMPIQQNKLFISFVYVLVLVTILDSLTSLDSEIGGFMPRFWVYASNCLYLMGTTSFAFFFAWYTLSLTETWTMMKNRVGYRILMIVPYAIVVVLILSTPFFRNPENAVFYLDENNYYHRGTVLFYILYAVSALYLFITLFLLCYFRNEISKSKRNLIIVYYVTIIISVALQFFIPELLVECFGIALTVLTFLFFIQKPEEVLDPVTNLFNQTAFIKMYVGHGSPEEKVTILSINLNDIDFLSNTFGIRELNGFSIQIADFLRQNFGFSKIFTLKQGNYCIVLRNKTEEEIQKILQVISNRFRNTWLFNSLQWKFYAQICVINCPDDAKSPEEVFDLISIAASDERYKSPVVYGKFIDLEIKRQASYIERCVRKGLAENRFEVYYQPIYSAEKKRVIGGEALVRLRDDKGVFLNPEIFIPMAEKNGTILRIGEFVFETVCKDLSSIDLESFGVEDIHVNLSVAQCMQEILADQILTIKTMYGIPDSVIDLEITETSMAHTPEILNNNIQKLVDAGLTFSLDDYGSGYSNMSYMLNMPFSQIKIDKYIVWQAYKEKRSEIALQATIDMIKKLGMTVLAEGVETKEQAEWLMNLGCDFLQGYYYSKPVPFDAYLEVFNKDF